MTNSAGKKQRTPHIRCVWGLLCSLSSIDQQRNNISLFNVIDQINVPSEVLVEQKKTKKPYAVPVPHEIVLLWRRVLSTNLSYDELTVDIKLTLVDSTGSVLHETITPLVFEAGKRRMRFRIQTNALAVGAPGDYVYRVESVTSDGKFQTEYEIPFEVVEMPKNKI